MIARCLRLLLAYMLSLSLIAGCSPGPAATGNPEAAPGRSGGVATRIPRPTGTPSIPRAPSQQAGPLSGVVRIDAGDGWFLPEVVTITTGTTVRWYHAGEEPHNVTAKDESWKTGEIAFGGYAEHRFNTVGRFPYQCTLHSPGMSGMIVVVRP